MIETERFLIGIDIGSTTTKAVVLRAADEKLLWSSYDRHHAGLRQSLSRLLQRIYEEYEGEECLFSLVFTGSGSKPFADQMGVPFVQEVVANSRAILRDFPEVQTAVELGGQDAKVIFFAGDGADHRVADMRMNGSCAGGTGAFIDEIASLLRVAPEGYEDLAAKGTYVYDISGRCGVYAKTDIQPLLNQGASKEDIALAALHAIAKQTIGGLAQGLDMNPPILFEGGPLCFHPTLIRAFCERLNLKDEDIRIPERPELMVAFGAALSYGGDEAGKWWTKEDIKGWIQSFQEASSVVEPADTGRVFFQTQEEEQAFRKRHGLSKKGRKKAFGGCFHRKADIKETKAGVLSGILGIDCGSTTSKFVLMNDDGEILYSYYNSNQGAPVKTIKDALLTMEQAYEEQGIHLHIQGLAVTGYGETLIGKALNADRYLVETVAHARAASCYQEDTSFLLDIGGQDMKAIWISNGIITNIVVNEACSAGCGSFLENFAKAMKIQTDEIEKYAFASKNPAALGSRCTVFMNSSIITEQKNGKSTEDILAGLCRSVIENVFTKVIRIENRESLGDRILVQGGTFCNAAVLRALEQYLDKEVVRAPYPELMGAIGAARIMLEDLELDPEKKSTFVGFSALKDLTWTQETGLVCDGCGNHCKRNVIRYSTGQEWVTGNRCERGASTDPEQGKQRLKKNKAKNLYKVRKRLLLKNYPAEEVSKKQDIVIGLPLVLAYWDTLPFWKVFYKSLGFDVLISPESTKEIYEQGLYAVTSDTECFPGKLVHGHIRWLEEHGADRIFMPSITARKSENMEKTSESMCGIVKGYPIVIRNSDNPVTRSGIPFDAPLFHWHTDQDRESQLSHYMKETFGISYAATKEAIKLGDHAQNTFKESLEEEGRSLLQALDKEKGTFAVVLASRPYQNDELVNHSIPDIFTEQGISVLTADAIPGHRQIDLHNSRLDIVNNYHARMLSSAIYAAEHPRLEYVQLVSFGCGHDAYLTDEIIRMMGEISGKTPLILKVDETDAKGPVSIRVRSFLATVKMRRDKEKARPVKKLSEPYKKKYEKKDRKERIVFVPNTSHAFARVMAAAMSSQGIRAVPLPVGREKAIALGKKYVHNDICFPAQVVIGEALEALETEEYKGMEKAIGMGKYVGCCRLTHYAALLRKALDEAGYKDVPILTNDDVDDKNLHPGFHLNLITAMKIAYALPMVDALEGLLRKIRPYELIPGSADQAFEKAMDEVIKAIGKKNPLQFKKYFQKAIGYMKEVKYDRSNLKEQVLIVGEYLLNFHPGANHEIERYLEKNGFEIIEAKMSDVIQKTYFYQVAQAREYKVKKGLGQRMFLETANAMFDLAHNFTNSVAKEHPLYQPAAKLKDFVQASDPVIHHTYDSGEGFLIPAEIIENAKEGCRAFVILQPFGCLPNHIVGRGISKKIKQMFPDIHLLPLDYDPDVSFANIENRLQMLIMSMKR